MPMSPRLLRPIAAGGFDPRSISGLSSWVDFSDLSTLGPDQTGPGAVTGEIGYVKNKASTTGGYLQSTGASRPVISSINGLTAADWGSAANNKRLQGTHRKLIQEVTVVFTWDAGGATFGGFETLYGDVGEVPGFIQGFNTTQWAGSVQGTSASVQFLNNTATNVAFPAIASGDAFVVQAWNSGGFNRFGQVGMDRNIGSRGWKGRIGEVVAYDRGLTEGERTAIRRGLARKWKITL